MITHTSNDPFLSLEAKRFFWLIKLRSVALIFQIPLSFLGRSFGFLNEKTQVIFLASILLFLCYNIFLHYSYFSTNKMNAAKKSISKVFVATQISFDLIVFTILLCLSGDQFNPFYAFFYVMAILGGILTSSVHSFFFLLLLETCVLFTQIYSIFSSDNHFVNIFNMQTVPHIFVQLFVPATIFFIARSLGIHLAKNEQHLLQVTKHNESLDRLRALGALSAGFSHEFASPLSTLKLRLNRLAKTAHPNPICEDIQESMLALNQCETVIRKMNSSQIDLRYLEFEEVILAEVVESLLEAWKQDHPDFPISFHPHSLAFVKISLLNFTQTFLNLMDNAFEATMGPKQNGQIDISIEEKAGEVVLIIQDNGSGFSSDVLKRMGEPFNTSKPKGTGLGLYSAHMFVHSVGGRIHIVNNDPQNGAKVMLFFPCSSNRAEYEFRYE